MKTRYCSYTQLGTIHSGQFETFNDFSVWRLKYNKLSFTMKALVPLQG